MVDLKICSLSNDMKKITPDINIKTMVETYPDIVEYLQEEWGFHCVTCIISGYENLEQGAATHGIAGEDFELLLECLNNLVE